MDIPKSLDPKEAELVLHLAREYRAKTREGIPAKRLVKLLYLLDLIARQYLGHAISSFRWIWWRFGPYDRGIEAVAKELVASELADRDRAWDGDNQTVRLTARHTEPLASFTPGEAEVIRYVVQNYLTMPMPELMNDVVYPSTPMQQGRRGALLPMAAVDYEGKETVGFDLEELLQAEQEIRAGKGAADF